MEINIKWNVCRVCLAEDTSNNMKIIFKKDDDSIEIYKKVSQCAGIEIKSSENLPDKICSKCSQYLKFAYKFRTTCRDSNAYLQSVLTKTKSVTLGKPKNQKSSNDGEKLNKPNEVAVKANTETLQDIDQVMIDEPSDFQVDYLEEANDENLDEEFQELLNDENIEKEEIESENNDNYTIIDEDIDDDEEEVQEFVDEFEEVITDSYLQDDEMTNDSQDVKPQFVELQDISQDETSNDADEQIVDNSTAKSTKRIYVKGVNGQYVCDVCGNNYRKKPLLVSHMKSHHGIKPYKCEVCEKTFSMSCNVIAHMRTHTGEKPFECQFCNRRFANRSTHLKHERIHRNERPFVCPICNKAFTYSNGLKAHEKVHTGEKNHRCVPCDKNFALPHQLKAHINTNTHTETVFRKINDDSYN